MCSIYSNLLEVRRFYGYWFVSCRFDFGGFEYRVHEIFQVALQLLFSNPIASPNESAERERTPEAGDDPVRLVSPIPRRYLE